MVADRAFRFGTGDVSAASREQLFSLSRKVEDLGYNVYFASDHFTPTLAASLALLAVAEATQKLRICSYVYDNDFRHPALLAKEAATLDLLSTGRFDFGIGAGWLGSDYAMTGIQFDPPNVRASKLIESVEIVKRLLSGEKVTFAGSFYNLTEMEPFPPPLQTPHPPILIGGAGKRVLSLAAREANIVSLVPRSKDGAIDLSDSSLAATARRIQWIRESAGERFDALELNTLVFRVIVTDHRQQAVDQLAREWSVPIEYIQDTIHFLIGSIEQITEDIQRWREQFGISYVTIFPEDIDTFAPVVGRLSGR